MLSVASVSTGAASSGYYKTEGYYANDSQEARDASQWFGKGAEAAGLSGHVSEKTFDEVMQGLTPDERRLGKEIDGEHVHKAGTDLTFSAPKSVSVMALVAGDARVIEAHDKAVRTALGYVENRFLQTRITNSETGIVERVGGQKMVAGVFRHDASRNLDPQLHTHAVVANMTVGADGKWRTVENRALFDNKMEIGAVYRNALAANLHEIGYEVERQGKHGFVEIAGVPKAVAEAFSTRREEIKTALERSAVGPGSAAAAARATLITRNVKTKDIDRAGLYALWREEAAAKGFDRSAMESLMSRAEMRLVTPEDRVIDARAALDYAVAHISERQSVYETGEVVKTALSRMKRGDAADLAREMDRRMEAGELIRVVDSKTDGLMTDAKTVLSERAVIAELREARGAAPAIASKREVDRALYGATVTDGQRAAVVTALASEDRVVGVQGYAGTGKTYMLAKARAIAAKNGYEMVGFAPSHRAVHELAGAGVEANTLQSFLARNEGLLAGRMSPEALDRMKADYATKAIVVDEASMISTGQMRDLLHIANRIEAAKVILVGDVKQLDAVEAGSPFRSLQKAGMETAHMADIMRQRNPEMLAAVHHIIRSEVNAFFEKVGDRVVEHANPAAAVGEAWLALSGDGRRSTMLITQTNEWRREINDVVRGGLRDEGELRGPDVAVARLDPLRLTTAQLGVAENYRPGEAVIFEREIKSLGVAKGETFSVIGGDETTVRLKAETNGREIDFEPGRSTFMASSVTLYERDKIDLSVGDKVRFDRTDLDEGVMNKATGEILAIDDRKVTINLGGEEKTFARGHDLIRHLDYAWGSTVHGAQGATVENALVAMNAESPLSTQKSAYVAASRVKDDVILFTNDADRLKGAISRYTGERLDARDVVGDHVNAIAPERSGEAPSRAEISNELALDAYARGAKGEADDAAKAGPSAEAKPGEDDAPFAARREQDAREEEPRVNRQPEDIFREWLASAREDAKNGERPEREEARAQERPEENRNDDGDREDARSAERAPREEALEREPELPFEHPEDDRFVRDEMRHGAHADRGEADAGRDDERSEGKGAERGDDGGVER